MAKTPKPSLSTSRQSLPVLGVRDRIVFPSSPRKVVAGLHHLADLCTSPQRPAHPLLWTRFGHRPAEFLAESEQDALKVAAAMATGIKDATLRGEPFQLTRRLVRKLPGSCPCRPTNAPTP